MRHAQGWVWVAMLGGLLLGGCPGDTEIAQEPLSGGDGNTAGDGNAPDAGDNGSGSDALAGRSSANAGTQSEGGSSGSDDDDPTPVAGSGGTQGNAGTDSGEGGSTAAGSGGSSSGGSGGVVLPKCRAGGCSGQVCEDAAAEPIVTTCEFRDEYACYQTASCEAQSDGQCGWTQTPELEACLQNGGPLGMLQWYRACGDPTCLSADPTDDSAIPNCTNEQVGDSCDLEGVQCDGIGSCGAKLICAMADPATTPGGCDR